MEFDDIETVAVLGAGSMGHGIAEVAALSGFEVNLRDVEEEFVRSGYDDIEWSLEKLAEKERITDDAADDALARVTASMTTSASPTAGSTSTYGVTRARALSAASPVMRSFSASFSSDHSISS